MPRIAVALLTAALFLSPAAADWPGFRGGRGGEAAGEADLPVTWTKDDFRWKVKLPGPGASSPVVTGGKVFVTAYSGYGLRITKGFGDKSAFGKVAAKAGDPKDLRLHVLCYDAATGKPLWDKEIAPKLPESPFANFLREHGYASSTPVTDGERLYVFFGKTGVFAFDLTGSQLWRADVGAGVHEWGSASSPALTTDLVVVNASVESGALVALDKRTGKEAWRVGKVWTGWTSPVVVTTKDG